MIGPRRLWPPPPREPPGPKPSDMIIVNGGCSACAALERAIQAGEAQGQQFPEIPILTRQNAEAARVFRVNHGRGYPAAVIGGNFVIGVGAIRQALAQHYGFRT